MGSWVGPWVPFSKLSRLKAIETCEILIEQRDKQIARAEAAEAERDELRAELDENTELEPHRAGWWRKRANEAEAEVARLGALIHEDLTRAQHAEAHAAHLEYELNALRARAEAAEAERDELRAAIKGYLLGGRLLELRGVLGTEGDRPVADHVGILDGPPLRGEGDR